MVLFVHSRSFCRSLVLARIAEALWRGTGQKMRLHFLNRHEGIFQFSIKLNHLYAWMTIFTDEMRCNFRLEHRIGHTFIPTHSTPASLTANIRRRKYVPIGHCPHWIRSKYWNQIIFSHNMQSTASRAERVWDVFHIIWAFVTLFSIFSILYLSRVCQDDYRNHIKQTHSNATIIDRSNTIYTTHACAMCT